MGELMGIDATIHNVVSPVSKDDAGHVAFVDVGKSYDAKTLSVRDVNLSVRRGEFFTLLGPSGSGKTSCLMMLAGFERATVGEIRLAGRSLASVAPYDRNIGVVFQSYALFPHMTVAENVAFPLTVRKLGRGEVEERTKWILGMVRLDEYAGRYPSQLSGGQQQRVALARALVFNPDLVLMDEPLGALDRQLREHLQIEIRRIQQEIGATVIFVTHDQSEALSMSDRIAVFNKGTVQQADTPLAIYARPDNAFVAAFVGDSIRLDGTVILRSGDAVEIDVPALGRLRGVPVDAGAEGSRAAMILRPEHVSLSGADGGSGNTISVRVTQTVFFGQHIRVKLVHSSGASFFTNIAASGTASKINDEIQLRWSAEDARVYAAG